MFTYCIKINTKSNRSGKVPQPSHVNRHKKTSTMRVAEGGGLGVNDSPVDCQSQTMTEPQRDG